MAERRPLVAALKANEGVEAAREKDFVYGEKREPEKPAQQQSASPAPGEARAADVPKPVSRTKSPLTTRIRADYGTALKRASLERELNGQVPYTVQDILEDALGPWLRANGYIQ